MVVHDFVDGDFQRPVFRQHDPLKVIVNIQAASKAGKFPRHHPLRTKPVVEAEKSRHK